ncbi:amidase [Ferrovibrio sp.]|uniref:amidase n=1 Tax=Ferrovibrio sp. TaxID=1917215 RepID=UPI001B7BA7E5|nr:amidase [Ferrovibrio sp.]MBP7064315.1 amidase [Ferrovibrio sp.]
MTSSILQSDARSSDLTAIAEQMIARIAQHNPTLNAVIRHNPDAVRAEAARLQDAYAAGQPMPLYGHTFTVKDNLWVAGEKISQGSLLFRDFIAPEEAWAVARLRQAGALYLGITNCSEFACKGMTTNLLHGLTRHPQAPELTPGGSSGGAAAALGVGIGDFALATDAGGSARRPAAHCGLVGFKPSAGAIPLGPGFSEPVFGHGVIAPMARCMTDLRSAFSVLAAFDPRDPASCSLPPAFAGNPIRIAFSPSLGLDVAIDDSVRHGVENAVEALRAAGMSIAQVSPAWPDGLGEAGFMPLQYAGLAALYGARYHQNPELFDPDIGRQIEAGLTLQGQDVAAALLLRETVAKTLARFFGDFDLLLCPTVPCTAWPATQLGPAQIGGRPAAPRDHAVFTPIFNQAGVPAISVPCGRDAAGLPFGMQIIARRFADNFLLDFAARAETIFAECGLWTGATA